MIRRKRVPILYEDDWILVCEKPIGMPTQSDSSRDMDVETYLKHLLYERQEGEEEPYLAVIHRLDRPVGGLMVFAKTKEAAARLSLQIQNHEFEKCYQAIVCGSLPEETVRFEDDLLRDGRTNTTSLVAPGTKGAKHAVLDYELIDEIETKDGILSWVLVYLETGRHHQIRVQFAARGLGLYGDTKYNPIFQKRKKHYTELGLYSTRVAFTHPGTGEMKSFKVDPKGEAFDLMDVEAY